ncbi:hypothetical protein [Flavobacterium sp. 7A]|uniref:hypothetical protein n=1 Tax=Flavobacterium sp. 7A TaxID=2940571 RepID=UPI002227D82E|nr:hypothetical protein [Flavobacterium sp. 7A]MCW2120545.1 hypothetical protein [Flavobacterium sp. 7A]
MPKTYIAEWIKLDFFNNSNLKTDIQNRISNNIEVEFITSLHDMKGDNKDNFGIPFSDITLLAMAYFYSEIFTDKIKDEYYTLEMVKGFFDANNFTPYTAIHEIDVVFVSMKDAPYFKDCWLIIQSAWFFNSSYFGHHQHIDYVNHYISTGEKLPIENYNFDRNYLEKKYGDIDSRKSKRIPINGFTLVNQWYYGILFLICSERKLSTKHFVISTKHDRIYNPLVKTSRQLRMLAPFKIIECDIKSAFPTFLDIEAGATLKDHVYNNLMKAKKITRGEAKILFNSVCNSGKYKSIKETTAFFMDCGYTPEQCKILISFTHDSNRKFIFAMTEYESLAINNFTTMNDLKQGARLHDAIIFIDDKNRPQILQVPPNCDFGIKELNRPILKEYFKVSNKRLNFAYINSIPRGLNLISKHDFAKPEVKGISNGFKFYKSKFEYISASFNLNEYNIDYYQFIGKCTIMFNTLLALNNSSYLNPVHRFLILRHIRQHSNYIFNVRALQSKFKAINPSLIISKSRDYDITENMTFKKKIDFLNAMNEAKKLVTINCNYLELFDLMLERLTNNDFSYIDNTVFTGHKKNNLLSYAIVRIFNILCTGRSRTKRKTVKSEPLYLTPIKSLTIKSISLKKQQQNAFIKKGIAKYEKELIALNKLVCNREKAKHLFIILCDVAGQNTDLNIKKDAQTITELKTDLLRLIDNTEYLDCSAGEIEFDSRYKTIISKEIPVISDLQNIFETDLRNSIFNQIDIEKANDRGETFFNEYLKFHGLDKVSTTAISSEKPKEKYKLPEIDFD